jgi:anthranilate/para-aminobenzoate synthase component I
VANRAPLISKVAAPGATLRMLAHTRPAQFPVFLDSAAEGPLTRYSMLAFEPSAALLRDGRGALSARGGTQIGPGGFLDNLGAWLKREATPRDAAKPLPFMGGWLVYLSYELAQEV